MKSLFIQFIYLVYLSIVNMGSGCCKTDDVKEVKISQNHPRIKPESLDFFKDKSKEHTELTVNDSIAQTAKSVP